MLQKKTFPQRFFFFVDLARGELVQKGNNRKEEGKKKTSLTLVYTAFSRQCASKKKKKTIGANDKPKSLVLSHLNDNRYTRRRRKKNHQGRCGGSVTKTELFQKKKKNSKNS